MKHASNLPLRAITLAAILTAILAATVSPTLSAQSVDCAQIEDARERLACFDRKYPRDANKPNVVPGIQSSAPVSRSAPAQAPTPPAAQPAPGVLGANTANTKGADAKRDDAGFPKGGLLDAKEKVEFTTTIEAIRARDKQKTIFRLANNQIWMQSSPRALPFKVGDEVIVKSATIGGYIMRNNGGTATRVERVK